MEEACVLRWVRSYRIPKVWLPSWSVRYQRVSSGGSILDGRAWLPQLHSLRRRHVTNMRIGLLAIILTLGASTTFGDVLPPVEVTTSSAVELYENTTDREVTIVVQARDNRTSVSSEIRLKSKGGPWKVPDGTTKAFSIVVPPGGVVTGDCEGTGNGKCIYVIATPACGPAAR